MNRDKKLVYSTDLEEQKIIDRPPAPASLNAESKFIAIFRLEKNGRGGKTVTVIHGLPTQEKFLKDLTKEIKIKCGVGGTFEAREGLMEIQGDQREKIKKILDLKGIKYKGV